MVASPFIILVDDERDLGEALAEYLSSRGYRAGYAESGVALDKLMQRGAPDLLVLDLAMPGEGGRQILARLKPALKAPVIILTSSADEIDRIVCLEMGADDFISKPVAPRELAARIAQLLKRYGAARPRKLLRFETATADLAAARLMRDDGSEERLGFGEVQLLRAFASAPGRVLSRDDLLTLAPAEDTDAIDRAIDARVMRLRRKIGTERIMTVRGRGYVFEEAG